MIDEIFNTFYDCEKCGAEIELTEEDDGYVCGLCWHEEIFPGPFIPRQDDKEI